MVRGTVNVDKKAMLAQGNLRDAAFFAYIQ